MELPSDFKVELERALDSQLQKSTGYCFIALDPEDCYYNLLWNLNQASLATFKEHFDRVYAPDEYSEISAIVKGRIDNFLEKFPKFKVGSL